jgi:hypothetical protein
VPLFLGEASRGEAIWIKELREWMAAGKQRLGQGLLLRYFHILPSFSPYADADGDRYGPSPKITSPAGSPLSILTAPVEVLKTSNIEIVIAAEIGRNPLVLTFLASNTPGARAIEYPVHRTVFYAGSGKEGIRTLVETASAFPTKLEQVLRLISLPGGEGNDVGFPSLRIVDLNAGETGLQWLKEWLLSGTVPEKGRVLKPVVESLLRDVVWDAVKEVDDKDSVQPPSSPVYSSRGDSADTLARAIAAWSKAAHKELHDSLQTMFSGKEWAMIEWWKLLWRVDDVGTVGKSIINKGFLRQSDDGVTFLTGRMFGAGYSPPLPFAEDGQVLRNISEGRIDPHGAWWTVLRPSYIGQQREDIIRNLVPSLQSSANKYLLAAFSCSGISWVFSVLLYMSEVSLYSASTAAAVGTVMSLRWLQKKWIKERKKFEETVREKGREAIVGCERWSWEKMAENLRRDIPQDLDRKIKERENLRKVLEDGIKLLK